MTLPQPKTGRPRARLGEAQELLESDVATRARTDECWEWPFHRDEHGYGIISRAGRMRRLHRVAFELANGHPANICRHTCDNPPCYNPAHLLDGTRADNSADCTSRGRHRAVGVKGTAHYAAKLTVADVQAIRLALRQGESRASLGRRFGVHANAIQAIDGRRNWAWLPDSEDGRSRLGVLASLLLLAGLVLGVSTFAGAQGAEVDYRVGDMAVASMLTRNPSCSITRNFRNDSPVPLNLIARAEWDGHPAVFPFVGDSAYTGPQVLQPGEQTTAVWNGVDRDPPTLSSGPVRLLINAVFTDGSNAFASDVEFVPACSTTPTEPPVASSAPPAPTGPSPSEPAPPEGSVPPVSPTPGPEPSTPSTAGNVPGDPPTTSSTTPLENGSICLDPTQACGTGVLTSSTRRLAVTGRDVGPLLVIVGIAVTLGALAILTGRHLRKVGQAYDHIGEQDQDGAR